MGCALSLGTVTGAPTALQLVPDGKGAHNPQPSSPTEAWRGLRRIRTGVTDGAKAQPGEQGTEERSCDMEGEEARGQVIFWC